MDRGAPNEAIATGEGRRILARGVVQGVGFRPWVARTAAAHGVTGGVRNTGSGVEIEAHGPRHALEGFLAALREDPPRHARVVWSVAPIAFKARDGFEILPSPTGRSGHLALPPDLGPCEACLDEVRGDGRRAGYPFTACTDCGPRFTLTTGHPYDRERTTLAPFPLCPECLAEYQDPADRRYHAQAMACPACGPRLSVELAALVARLRAGEVWGIKGIGGYHLACDATNEAAVARLRREKRRGDKPFAVLVADLAAAEALAELTEAHRALLRDPSRPIVLCPSRGALAPSVAPDTDRVGLLLPPSPLHALLAEVGPLVLTSGNPAGHPTIVDDALAREALAFADGVATADRAIARRADDSVAAILGGRTTFLRRGRGVVPERIFLSRPAPEPILAVGGHLKCAPCLLVGDEALIAAHVGDLDDLATEAAFEEALEDLQALAGVRAARVAHDLHPEYASTRWARACGLPAIGVQHHHAHVAAVCAEHGVDEPVVALAWDGTGYGVDGALWGGETLWVDGGACRRISTLHPVRLPGGERAIRQPWRLAVALLDELFGDQAAALAARLGLPDPGEVLQLVRADLRCPRAHGAGRWFDAFAVVALGRHVASFEGQLAMALEATGRDRVGPPLRLDDPSDLRPAFAEAVALRLAGADPGDLSARIHATFAAAGRALLEAARHETGARRVALAGGCFQSERLVGLLVDDNTLRAARVPPNDGGLSLGQAWVAGRTR